MKAVVRAQSSHFFRDSECIISYCLHQQTGVNTGNGSKHHGVNVLQLDGSKPKGKLEALGLKLFFNISDGSALISEFAQMALQGALRRSFVALQNQQTVWRSVLEECDPLMESLGNLGEQMGALSRVRVSDTPLRVFPDLQERLQFQLLQAADLLLQRLRDRMSRLQSVRDSIGNQVSAVLQLYEETADCLDLAAVTERSSLIPSLTDMLEWLQDAERFYRQQFLQRKTLLQTLRLDDLSQVESASKRWKALESPDSEQEITDTLCRLSFFMESQ